MATATRRHDSCHDNTAGFSLITISVLLTVASLVFVSVLPGQESGDVNQKILSNDKRLARVEEAMRSFMATNGRRPCPADGQYAENTTYFGIEAGKPGICTGNTAPIPNAPLGPDAGTGYVVGGVIPTKTLGLPDEYQYDDYGRRFTYLVDVRATESPAAAITNNNAIITGGSHNTHAPGCYNLEQNIKINGKTPAIAIQNTAGAGATIIDYTMYAYISHGASGYGAWPAQGASTPAGRINSGSTDVDMQVNAGVDHPGLGGTFAYNTTYFTNAIIQKDRVASNLPSGGTDTGFDDFVWYRPDTKNTCCLGTACLQTGFCADGTAKNVYAGSGVAIGDVNGDGIPDLVISGGSGKMWVVFGTRLGFPDPLPLASLNGVNGFELDDGIIFYGAISVGDINGDGIADIIIGGAAQNSFAGSVHVIFGHTGTWNTTPITLTSGSAPLDGVHGIEFDGAAANDYLGYSNISVGDVNGDGIGDLIMGAFYATENGHANAGAVYVVFGASGTSSSGGTALMPGTTVSTTNASTAITPASYTGLMVGETLTSANIPTGTTIHSCNAGNTTTYGTICTSNIKLSANATATAAGTAMTVASLPLVSSNFPLDGTHGVEFDGLGNNTTTASYEVGSSTAAADVNGDGITDLVIGGQAWNNMKGAVYVIFGYTGTWTYSGNPYVTLTSNSAPLDGTHGAEFDETTYDYFGQAVAAADLNGDGIGDLIMGAYLTNDSCCSQAGAVYVVFGKTGSWSAQTTLISNSAPLDGTHGFEFDGAAMNDFLGTFMAAGDVNGDGIADLVMDAVQEGAAYVVFGQKSGWSAQTTLIAGSIRSMASVVPSSMG